MITINLIIQFAKKYWKIILIVLLAFALWCVAGYLIKLRKENKRLQWNQEQITKENKRALSLKADEYNHLNTTWKNKLDSTLKANKLKIRNVQGATVVQTVYKDTGSTKIIYRDIIQLPDKSFKIPIEISEKCWGMKGYLTSMDANSHLEVTERTTTNSVQLVVIRKRFLGFLWFNGKTDFKAFTDCGQSDITKIDFIK